MASLIHKIKALDAFIRNDEADPAALLVASWLKSNPELLSRCEFVDQPAFIENILVLSESPVIAPVSLSMSQHWWPPIFERFKAGEQLSPEELSSVATMAAENSIYHPAEIIETLKEATIETYLGICLFVENQHKDIMRVVEVNPYIEELREMHQEEDESSNAATEKVNELVEAEIERGYANYLKNELDKALASRDMIRCKEIGDKLKEIEEAK